MLKTLERWVLGLLKRRTCSSPTSKSLRCCRRGEAARDAFPKLANWQARGPVPLTQRRTNLNMNSSVACWHNFTALFFFQQGTFNLCPDNSRQSCLISPIKARHLPTRFPTVRIFGSPAGWGPASRDLPHASSSFSPGDSPSLRLTISSKKFSILPSWIFCLSSHSLPLSSWSERIETSRGRTLLTADETMLPLRLSTVLCILDGDRMQSYSLLPVTTYPWPWFFAIYYCCYHYLSLLFPPLLICGPGVPAGVFLQVPPRCSTGRREALFYTVVHDGLCRVGNHEPRELEDRVAPTARDFSKRLTLVCFVAITHQVGTMVLQGPQQQSLCSASAKFFQGFLQSFLNSEGQKPHWHWGVALPHLAPNWGKCLKYL